MTASLVSRGLIADPSLRVGVSAVGDSGVVSPRLSAREVEILSTWLVCDTKVEVADKLFVTAATVRTHLARIRSKYRDVGRPAGTKIALVDYVRFQLGEGIEKAETDFAAEVAAAAGLA